MPTSYSHSTCYTFHTTKNHLGPVVSRSFHAGMNHLGPAVSGRFHALKTLKTMLRRGFYFEHELQTQEDNTGQHKQTPNSCPRYCLWASSTKDMN